MRRGKGELVEECKNRVMWTEQCTRDMIVAATFWMDGDQHGKVAFARAESRVMH